MPKISIIVPVYNTQKYLSKCLDSILSQKMQDFEIIVVNDGSTDNSKDIINEYIIKYPEKIKYLEKENGGLSDARNFGVKNASGKYLCFVDSDDYIEKDLFQNIEKYIDENIDLIKFKCIRVNEDNEIIEKVDGPNFEKINGEEAFNLLYDKDVFLEPAWLYIYNREYFENNKFEFPVNKYHEDWAIVPYIILMADSVVSINYYGYYYVQSNNSITRNNNNEKTYKRAMDMLDNYDNLCSKITKSKLEKLTIENYKIYATNCLILKLEELPNEYHKEYIKQLKNRKVFKNIKVRNFKQLIKRIILNFNIKLYLKLR